MRQLSTGRKIPVEKFPPPPSNAPTLVLSFQPPGNALGSVGSGAPAVTRALHLRAAQLAGVSLRLTSPRAPVHARVSLWYSSPRRNRLCPISCATTWALSPRVNAAVSPRLQPPERESLTSTITLVASGAKRCRMLVIRGLVRGVISSQQCDQMPVETKPSRENRKFSNVSVSSEALTVPCSS